MRERERERERQTERDRETEREREAKAVTGTSSGSGPIDVVLFSHLPESCQNRCEHEILKGKERKDDCWEY